MYTSCAPRKRLDTGVGVRKKVNRTAILSLTRYFFLSEKLLLCYCIVLSQTFYDILLVVLPTLICRRNTIAPNLREKIQ